VAPKRACSLGPERSGGPGLGRVASGGRLPHPRRISRRGWASACVGRKDMASAAVGPPSGLRPRGSHSAPPASSQRAPWPDMSCRPRRLLRVSGRYPNGTRRCRRLGRAASLPRDRTRPDRRSGHAHLPFGLRILARERRASLEVFGTRPLRVYLAQIISRVLLGTVQDVAGGQLPRRRGHARAGRAHRRSRRSGDARLS
jgi:hypothetical protein